MKMKAEIEVAGNGRSGRIVLDGCDVSRGVRGFRVTSQCGELTRLELDLRVLDVTRLDSEETEIVIPDATRDALIALGWTPPAE